MCLFVAHFILNRLNLLDAASVGSLSCIIRFYFTISNFTPRSLYFFLFTENYYCGGFTGIILFCEYIA